MISVLNPGTCCQQKEIITRCKYFVSDEMQESKRRDIKTWPQLAAIAIIRLYQRTRFLREPSCRFYPSCSEYMARSIAANGLLRGVGAGMLRLAKCHPFHPGGVDEVVVEESFDMQSRRGV